MKDEILNLIGRKKENTVANAVIDKTLGEMYKKDIPQTKTRIILHPSEMWKDNDVEPTPSGEYS